MHTTGLVFHKATGGSGNYTWVSEDSKIGTVSTRGLLVATTTVGHSTVTVSDVRNPAHFDKMEVTLTAVVLCQHFESIICEL